MAVVLFPPGGMFLPFSTEFRPALGPNQSPIQLVPGSISPEIQRLGREADHSPPSSAKVNNGGAVCHGIVLI
jgi:hypothetical protein